MTRHPLCTCNVEPVRESGNDVYRHAPDCEYVKAFGKPISERDPGDETGLAA